ncbi:MAG: hypothetical protein IPL06_18470 [Betaproteobacteria bacterium]|nr:hypothetical protein [Betaproteobacteria bacterium]
MEKFMKIASFLGAASAVLVITSAIAAEEHPKYGGQVRETVSFDLELVAKDKELVLYVTDHKGKAIEWPDVAGSATVLSGKSKETVKLSGSGKGVLKGVGNFTITDDTKVVLSVTAGGKTEQARFAPRQKDKAEDHKGHKH